MLCEAPGGHAWVKGILLSNEIRGMQLSAPALSGLVLRVVRGLDDYASPISVRQQCEEVLDYCAGLLLISSCCLQVCGAGTAQGGAQAAAGAAVQRHAPRCAPAARPRWRARCARAHARRVPAQRCAVPAPVLRAPCQCVRPWPSGPPRRPPGRLRRPHVPSGQFSDSTDPLQILCIAAVYAPSRYMERVMIAIILQTSCSSANHTGMEAGRCP